MNAHASAAAGSEGVRLRGDGCTAEAGWFGPEHRPRFGWLYRPDQPAPNRAGIVIVPPFGREDICAHRTLRHLAETVARAGFVALRFDLDGSGDSAGDDSEPDRVAAWIASVEDACELVRDAGAQNLLLAGVRLGATLAALAAVRRRDVGALVAFNAVVSGRTYLRELRAFQAAMNLQPSPQAAAATGQESSGFLLTEATCAALKAIDLAALDQPPAPVVRLLERDDLPERKGLQEHLQARGAEVSVQRVPGYVEMMADPHANRVARAFIDACVESAQRLSAAHAPPAREPQALRAAVTLRERDGAFIEEVVAPGAGLFGILARPHTAAGERAVLMFNAGAVRHIGSNRIDVSLSRRLAAAGLQVLRADLSGIGDSPARAGEPENIVYGPHCLDDAAAMVTWLRARGARNIAAGGMCSGAWLALRTTMAGQALDAAYLVNCGVFSREVRFDPEGSHLFGDIAHYNSAVKSARAWHKLFTGKVAFGAVARVAAWHLGNHARRLGKAIARGLRLPLGDDLAAELRALARKGVRVHFLFSGNEPGRALLASQAGAVVPRLCRSGQFELRVLEGPDHTFTQRWAQALLQETLLAMLTAQGSHAR